MQNEILTEASKLIKTDIKSDVEKSKFWSVLADETQDRAKREQLVVVVRYVKETNMGELVVNEDAIAVLDLIKDIKEQDNHDHSEIKLSGISIANAISKALNTIGLDMQHLQGWTDPLGIRAMPWAPSPKGAQLINRNLL